MKIVRITAIVPTDILSRLEECLRGARVPGVTLEDVRGYGEHPNYFQRDLMRRNTRVVVYSSEAKAAAIVNAIIECARSVQAPTGILAVETIDRLVDLNDGMDIAAEAL